MCQSVSSFGSVGVLSTLLGTPSTGCMGNHSFGYWPGLVAGHKHTLTGAMVSVIRLERFKSIGRQMEICWVQGLMMRIWVVLGEVTYFVGSTWSPKM